MQTTEKDLLEIFNMVQVKSGHLHRTSQMMQLCVDPHKAGSIVGCRIVYVIFLIYIMS